MPAADILPVLLQSDRWATHQVLNAAAPLSDAQLDREFPIGHGTLRKTLLHVLNVKADWQASLERSTSTPLPDGLSVAELQVQHNQISDRFEAFAARSIDQTSLHAEKRGRKIDISPAAVLSHIVTHGMHHRAQALNILRQLGVAQPQGSVMQWAVATHAAKLE